MTVSQIQRLAHDIVAAGLASPEELVGCTGEDISALEKKFALTMPGLYVEWLVTMGRGAGKFLRGSDAFFPALLELRDSALELLAECGNKITLPHDAFVFLIHQGYQFLYFRTDQNDPDPPVIQYIEGEDPIQGWSHLSSYFQQVVQDHIRLSEEIKKFR